MRIGIRGKLVLLLVLVALLPLSAALVTIIVAGTRLREESFGQLIQSTASADALGLRVSLVKDVEKLRLALESESVIADELATRREALPEARRAELDRVWDRAVGPKTPEDRRILEETQTNPLALRLKQIMRADPRIAECFVTDRFGQLVAATGRTSDFDQADEDWWQGAYFHEQGRIFVPAIEGQDQSAKVLSVDVCIPIKKGGQFVGVAKTVISVQQWLAAVSRRVEGMPVSLMLANEDGKVLYAAEEDVEARGAVGVGKIIPGWKAQLGAGEAAGWRITEDGIFQAHAPIEFDTEIGGQAAQLPRWTLVLSVPASEPLSVVRRLSLTVGGIGLGLIAAVFLLGLLLAERSIIRRLRRLEHATRTVADGDLAHRIRGGWGGRRLLGDDEIDDLAGDFNRMVRRVQDSYEVLQTANELRTNFLQIAGHELRTPISYILGMTSLLKSSKDAARLRAGVRSMGAKAKRLDEIIQSMFKLMDLERHPDTIVYSDVEVQQLLEEVYLDSMVFVERRHQQLIIEAAPDIPVIRADSDKLRDVLENLVMNAVKFTPNGGVVRVVAGRQLGQTVAITVTDQGPGISEEDLPHIFEPFFSTADVMKHSSGTAGYLKRGMGLGLAIVRRFVELHHGTVHVSCGEEGTSFTVSIPFEPPPANGS